MKIIIERITALTNQKVTKELVAVIDADMLPALPGDALWIADDNGSRERHIILAVRPCVQGTQVAQILDVAKASLAKTLDRAMLAKAQGDTETSS